MDDIDGVLEEIIAKLQSAADIYNGVANGPEGQTVPTESGPVPTLLEWQRIHADQIDGLSPRVDDLETEVSDLQDDIAALATPSGINAVNGGDFSSSKSKLALFVSSQARSIDSLFSDFVRIDILMGLTPDDSGVDNLVTLNQILSVASAQRVPLDGYGKTFYISSFFEIPSNLICRRATFKLQGAPSGDTSAKSHIPAGSINGVVSPVTGIRLDDCWFDGSRELWPNISMYTPGPEGGGGEDGGMHALRIAGAVRDCYFTRCKFTNAASAGVAMHNPAPSVSTADFVKSGLFFDDCIFDGNGEHGFFIDGARYIRMRGGRSTGNGLDLNTSDPLTHGSRGRRDTSGKLFGCAFDIESYTGFMGSLTTDIWVTDMDCRGNAMMPILYNPIASNLAGYVACEGIRLINLQTDPGLAAGADRSDGYDGVGLLVTGNPSGGTWPYLDMKIDCHVTGKVRYNGVNELDQSSGFIRGSGVKGEFNNCGTAIDISCPSNSQNITLFPLPVATVTKTGGAAAATINQIWEVTRPGPSCGIEIHYTLAIAAPGVSVAAGGTLFTASISPPAGYTIQHALPEITTTGALPASISCSLNISAGTASLFVDPATSGANLVGTLVVVLRPNS